MLHPSSAFVVLVTALLPAAALSSILVDVAPLGTPSQTTSHSSGLYPAALAVDGDLQTFNHTDTSSPDNAWELDFATPYPVGQVDIIPRDCCGGRLNGAVLRLFDDELEPVFEVIISDPGPLGTFSVPISPALETRHVRIGFENGTVGIVHLAEVKIFAPIGALPTVVQWTATPSAIATGETSVLSWNVTNATSVEILSLGPVAFSNQTTVAPTTTTVYVLVATNEFGPTTRSTSIEVNGEALLPRISEFAAAPADGPDWIEIWNPGPGSVDLLGYHLTDIPAQPTLWTFPSVVLQPGELLVVGAGLAQSPGGLFTSFGLSRDPGSYLAFRAPGGGQILSVFTYPEQRTGYTYGSNLTDNTVYFTVPTPGELNLGPTTLGFVDPPTFSVARGFHTESFAVAITSAIPGAAIYYTTDNATPSAGGASSVLYTNPVQISGTTVLRAVATLPDHIDSWPVTHSYLFLDEVVAQPAAPPGFPTQWHPPGTTGALAPIPLPADYEMDTQVTSAAPFFDQKGLPFDTADALRAIPTFCLTLPTAEMWDKTIGMHANARKRGREWERAASLEIIDEQQGVNFHTGCGLRIHGGRTRVEEMLKKSFRLYFRREYGVGKLTYPLFDGQPENGFDHLVLRGGTGKAWDSPWRDLTGPGNSLERVTYLRDQFLRDSQRDMGHPHIGGGLVHLYINGLYWGLFNPVERPGGDYAAAHFGGTEDDYDVLQWANGLPAVPVNGDRNGWNEILALSRSTPAQSATYTAIAERLNLEQFIDHLLLNFTMGNGDWVLNNAYAFRSRTGDTRFRFLSWDGEEIFNSLTANSTGANNTDSMMEVHQDLRANADYRMLFADRTYKHLVHRNGALHVNQTQTRLAELAARIDRAVVAESARWADLLRPDEPYTREQHWLPEIGQQLRTYLVERPGITLGQLKAGGLYPNLDPPLFLSQEGGEVPVDYQLVLGVPTGQTGTIYYTLDGTDPRAPGGAISPTAQVFDSTSLPGDTTLKARIRNAGQWSALAEATFTIAGRSDDLVISEIMYHPSNPTAAESAAGITDDDLFEYIEIRNVGAYHRNLSDLSFNQGIDFAFSSATNTALAPGEAIVVVANAAAFQVRYGFGLPVAGAWNSGTKLDNGGERIVLAGSGPIRDFVYDDVLPWPTSPDGGGTSLVLVDPFSRPDHADPLNWRPSLALHGTPGGTDGTTFSGDPLADADGDGLAAFLEYALGTSDASASSGPGALLFHATTDGHLELTLPQNLLAEDLVITLQSSTNLVNWIDADPALVRTRVSHQSGGTAAVTYRTATPAADPHWFLRLLLQPR